MTRLPHHGAPLVSADDTLVDDLAQEIRRVDGSNSLGAGALAEALMPFLASRLPRQEAETRKAALEEADLLKWFGERSAHELSYGPVDERDEMGEHGWRVIEKRGNINDWEWHILATGNSPAHALKRARALSQKGDEADG
ncbi:hypothetical protein ACLNGM_14855 [Aureimonas phyllosphaerae]|uniref:hypothetical protein n=1 Tax=Aureimonas phyllosphaerae TaxID=1166078 RepID=UPI003A5C5188